MSNILAHVRLAGTLLLLKLLEFAVLLLVVRPEFTVNSLTKKIIPNYCDCSTPSIIFLMFLLAATDVVTDVVARTPPKTENSRQHHARTPAATHQTPAAATMAKKATRTRGRRSLTRTHSRPSRRRSRLRATPTHIRHRCDTSSDWAAAGANGGLLHV